MRVVCLRCVQLRVWFSDPSQLVFCCSLRLGTALFLVHFSIWPSLWTFLQTFPFAKGKQFRRSLMWSTISRNCTQLILKKKKERRTRIKKRKEKKSWSWAFVTCNKSQQVWRLAVCWGPGHSLLSHRLVCYKGPFDADGPAQQRRNHHDKQPTIKLMIPHVAAWSTRR